MVAWAKGSHIYEAFTIADGLEFEAFDGTVFNYVEFFTLISFLQDEIILFKVDCFEALGQFVFLGLVQWVEQLNTIK